MKRLLPALAAAVLLLASACQASEPSSSGGSRQSGGSGGSSASLAVSSKESSPASSSSASSGKEEKEAFKTITAKEAKAMLDEGGVTLVDVRTQEEYDEAHIPGALLVPNETIGNEPPKLLPDKSARLLVYCRSGVRSRQASEKLASLGYEQVHNMGGIIDWPYETTAG